MFVNRFKQSQIQNNLYCNIQNNIPLPSHPHQDEKKSIEHVHLEYIKEKEVNEECETLGKSPKK